MNDLKNKHIKAKHENSTSDSRKGVVDQLHEAITLGENDKIVQLFLDSYLLGRIPKGPHMLTWLKTQLHDEGFKCLIEAFVKMTCFNCHNGLTECKDCDGKGHTELDLICRPCLGLGVVLCNYCGGSAWVPIDYVSSEFNAAVFATRLGIYVTHEKTA